MTLSRSRIEYLTHGWNPVVGCAHWLNPEICPVGEHCWARQMAKRFGRSFAPHIDSNAILHVKPPRAPAVIGVSFVGDLFGEWWDKWNLSEDVLNIVKAYPQHRFLFLTKNPFGLLKWGVFPGNAYVGVSVCNQKMFNEAITILDSVRAEHKWLSFEPLLQEIIIGGAYTLDGLSWIACGAQTQPNLLPELSWVKHIVEAADKAGANVWLKRNLLDAFPDDLDIRQANRWAMNPFGGLRQEIPW